MSTDKGTATTVKPKMDRVRPTTSTPARPSAGPSLPQKANKYLTEVRTELKKTTWPTKTELISQTQVVIGLLVVIGVFIAAWDQVLGLLFKGLLAALGIEQQG